MKNIVQTLLTTLFFALIFFLLFGIGFAVIGGVVYLMGWLIRLLLPLSLFESLVVSSLLTSMTVLVTRAVLNFFLPADSPSLSNFRSDSQPDWVEPTVAEIPTTRFYKSADERTWEMWLNREIANDIYADFQLDPEPIRTLNDSQRQELAIRLASLSVSILKRKNSGSKNLEINANAIRREMERIGQKVYEADILAVAVDAVNTNVDYYEDELSSIIRERSWNQIATDVE